jgi:hypothetical protein
VTWVWVACTLLPFGMATPIVFGVAGGRTRKASWIVAAVLYAILSWGGFVLAGVTEEDSDPATLAGLMLIVAWAAGPAPSTWASSTSTTPTPRRSSSCPASPGRSPARSSARGSRSTASSRSRTCGLRPYVVFLPR